MYLRLLISLSVLFASLITNGCGKSDALLPADAPPSGPDYSAQSEEGEGTEELGASLLTGVPRRANAQIRMYRGASQQD